MREEPRDLVASEDDGKFSGPLRPGELAEVPELDFKDVLVEEYDGVERLILGRSSDVAFHGQMTQKCVDFGSTHLIRVSLTMKENESPDPLQVGFFRPQAVVFDPKDLPHLIEKLRLRSSHSQSSGGLTLRGCWNGSFGHWGARAGIRYEAEDCQFGAETCAIEAIWQEEIRRATRALREAA